MSEHSLSIAGYDQGVKTVARVVKPKAVRERQPRAAAIPRRARARGDLRIPILSAAAEVFGERGYGGATTREIARRAGVAEGTVFNYFPTKKEILVAMMEHEVLDALPDYFRDEPGDDLALLEALFRNRIELWRSRGRAFRAVLAEAFFDEELAEEMRQRVFRVGLSQARRFIESRVEAGTIAPYSSERVAFAVVALVIGAGLMADFAGGDDCGGVAATLPSDLASLVLQGLAPR
jgi:AcrR family transcriptional regulator